MLPSHADRRHPIPGATEAARLSPPPPTCILRLVSGLLFHLLSSFLNHLASFKVSLDSVRLPLLQSKKWRSKRCSWSRLNERAMSTERSLMNHQPVSVDVSVTFLECADPFCWAQDVFQALVSHSLGSLVVLHVTGLLARKLKVAYGVKLIVTIPTHKPLDPASDNVGPSQWGCSYECRVHNVLHDRISLTCRMCSISWHAPLCFRSGRTGMQSTWLHAPWTA
eukprot:263164-Amphidinium_carterae.2